MKKIMVLIVSLLLLGCDADVKTTVTMSQLNSNDSFSNAILAVEIPSCTDYKDSRNESSSLINMKKEILELFKTIEYKECYRTEMKSFASFEIPVLIGSDLANSKDLDKIDLAIAKKDKIVSIIALPEMRNKLTQFQKRNFSNLKFKITISFLNDTDTETDQIIAVNKFINGAPYDNIVFSIKPNGTVDITLSDVSSQILLKADNNQNNPQGITQLMQFQ